MSNNKQIVIVGGGTSGWLSATFLSRALSETCLESIDITLIESSDIPPIGVGEATTPSLRGTLSAMGIEETEFMRECEATFKHGIKFSQWKHAPGEMAGEYYFHPFQAPMRSGVDFLTHHWLNMPVDSRGKFANRFGVQQALAELNIAPKAANSGSYAGPLPYAYHLDAGKLAIYLREKAIGNGVNHVIGEVADLVIDDDYTIRKLLLKNGDTYSPDLVIDCTGFGARLINYDKRNRFEDKTDQLFCDRAIATRVRVNGYEDVRPYTTSTALANGWVWDISLTERKGVGHVYSSQYCSDDDAVLELANYLRIAPEDLEYRMLKMRIGYHRRQWRGNCVAVGLSAGFLEPLESTGIYLVEMAIWLISQSVPRYFAGQNVSVRFDRIMNRHFENIVDFVKAHYCLSDRADSPFWVDNRREQTIPESLKERLEMWDASVPNDYDFDSNILCFNSDNYQYILYGMAGDGQGGCINLEKSIKFMDKIDTRRTAMLERMKLGLADNAKLLQQIHEGVSKPHTHGAAAAPGAFTSANNYRVR